MAKHTASTLLHKPENYSIDMGVLENCGHHIRNCKKTQSVIRMTAVTVSHQLHLFSFLIQGHERLHMNTGIQENLTQV